MNNEKLKPCPFCGGEAVVHTLGTGYMVECLECAVSTVCENTKAEAVAAWNRRSYSKKSNNSKSINYSEKQDSPNELMDFVKFCQNASTGCIVYINNRARDIIAKSKGKRVCVKQNAEKLYTNSVASSGVNAKLTYADIEKMVAALEWTNWKDDLGYCSGAEASVSDVCFYVEEKLSGEEDEIKTFDASIEDFQFLGEIATLEAAKSACHDFLVDLVAAALGVERSGE